MKKVLMFIVASIAFSTAQAADPAAGEAKAAVCVACHGVEGKAPILDLSLIHISEPTRPY